jgi:hypothetical protein
MKLVGTLLSPGITAQWLVGGGSGAARKRSATAQKQVLRALKWQPRQRGGVGWPEVTQPEVRGVARARIGAGGQWLE